MKIIDLNDTAIPLDTNKYISGIAQDQLVVSTDMIHVTEV